MHAIDSENLFGQLSIYLHVCFIAMQILFFLPVQIGGAVPGNEGT